MPTFTVRELYDGRDAARGESSRDFVRVWSVQQTDGGQPAAMGQVLDANGIPKVGDPYLGATVAENDLGVACKRVRARHNRSNKLFLVEAQYASANWGTTLPSEGGSSAGGGGGGGESAQQLPPGFGGGDTGEGTPSASPVQIDNPLFRPAVVRYGAKTRTTILLFDEDLTPILNSARQRFDPPVTLEQARLSMFVEQNVALFDPAVIAEYCMAINSAKWCNGAAKTWRCEDIGAERMFEEGIFYWKRHFLFVYNPDEWNPYKVLDVGTHYYESIGDTTPVRFGTKFGEPTSGRGLLDGAGGKLPRGDNPVPLEFNIHAEKDFGALKLF